MPHADPIVAKAYHKAYSPAWQKANRALLREYATRYRTKYPARMLWIAARNRAKKRGISFEITEADVMIPDICPVLGMPLIPKPVTKDRTPSHNSPSLDRINPRLGYVPGNVQVISWRANTLKHDGTSAELFAVATFVAAQEKA